MLKAYFRSAFQAVTVFAAASLAAEARIEYNGPLINAKQCFEIDLFNCFDRGFFPKQAAVLSESTL